MDTLDEQSPALQAALAFGLWRSKVQMSGMSTDEAIDLYHDPKPLPRLRDPEVFKRFHAIAHECLCCGRSRPNAAHLLGKAQGGDDVDANLIPLCGSGSSGCHGAYHGNPYRGDFGRMVTRQTVEFAIGAFLAHEAGEDHLRYLQSKRSDGWIEKRFGVEL